jgi:ferredoxin
MKNPLSYNSCILGLILLFSLAGQAYGFNYLPSILKRNDTRIITLQQVWGKHLFTLDLIPGKIRPGDKVKLRLEIVGIPKDKKQTGSTTKSTGSTTKSTGSTSKIYNGPTGKKYTGPLLQARFSQAYSYLGEDETDISELSGEWIPAQLDEGKQPYLWEVVLPAEGDYILDFRLPTDKEKVVTFYLTVSPEMAPGESPKYLGDRVCRWCHYVQYQSMQKIRKSSTYDALKPGQRIQAKTKAGLDPARDYTQDAKCLKCHTTGYGKPGGFISMEKTPHMTGVQCEACHGPGERFTEIMRRKYSFAHSEVEDLGHIRYSWHAHTPKGHIHGLDETKLPLCEEMCHNRQSPTYRPLKGRFKDFVKKGAHQLYGLKFTHWGWEDEGGSHSHHTMSGIPDNMSKLTLWTLGGVTIFFLGMATVNREEKPYFSWSLFRSDLLYRIMRARPFQFIVQAPFVILLFLIIAAGLFGNPLPNRNIAPIMAWTLWWALIIFDIVFLGRMWCLICPWDALASPVQRLALWRRKKRELNLGISWPSWLKNVHMATFLFILLTWLELGYGITQSPKGTAILGILMTVLAVGFAILFNKKAFCQYGCLIGRICGIYSMSSPLELRKINTETCRSCLGKDCYTGNDRGYPCPTNQLMEKMDANTYCTLCTECIKSCPHENISLNIRSFGADLLHFGKARHDEAIMALVMLSLSSFHGLTMTPIWVDFTDWIMKNTGWSYLSAFTLGMTGIILLPFLLYTVVVRTSKYLAGGEFQLFNHFAYPLVTVALFYHLAHNTGHILAEGLNIVPVLSDPFGWGWDLLGTALWKPYPILMGMPVWWIQLGMIVIGHFYACRVLVRISRRLEKPRRIRAIVPIFFFVTFFSLINLWLLTLPMQMRTAM